MAMKYEEPNMQIIMIHDENIVRTSRVESASGIPGLGDDMENWDDVK